MDIGDREIVVFACSENGDTMMVLYIPRVLELVSNYLPPGKNLDNNWNDVGPGIFAYGLAVSHSDSNVCSSYRVYVCVCEIEIETNNNYIINKCGVTQ